MLTTNLIKKILASLCCIPIALHCLCQVNMLPIQPTREISFIIDEGSYMSIDVSPDGKTLVFDLLGDLYTLPVTGGNATQLTEGIALNAIPAWSPDGSKIAYVSDKSGDFCLNIMDVKRKSNITLGQSMVNYRKRAVWVFSNNFVALDTLIYSLTGGRVSIPKSLGTPIRASSDGRALFYSDYSRISRYDCTSNTSEVISPKLTGVSSRGNVALSSDLKWCAYISQYQNLKRLVIQNMQDSTRKIVGSAAMFAKDSAHSNNVTQYFAFSPDGKYLFISYGGKIHRINVENGEDVIIPFTTNVKVVLGKLDYNTFRITDDSLKVKYTRSANLSPDGKSLVFAALNKIYIKYLPNGNANVIVNQSMGQFQPAFSPDGKWIAYTSWSDAEGGFLWIVSAKGGEPKKLTSLSGNYQHPTWSPDRKQIAVIKAHAKISGRGGGGVGELQMFSLEGREVKTIDTIPLPNYISFSSSGKKIFYRPVSDKAKREILVGRNFADGKKELVAIGTEPHGSSQYYPTQISISPDERFIVYLMGEDLFLLPAVKMLQSTLLTEREANVPIPIIKIGAGVDAFWSSNGKSLSWTYGNKYYSIDPDKIIEAAERKSLKGEKNNPGSGIISVKFKPDKIIDLNVIVSRYSAKGLIALKNARLITMHGERVIENGTILIKNNRIIAVGKTDDIAIPKQSKVMDLSGNTVMPGIVDLHLHMGVSPDIFPQQPWMFLANLAYGVTTARDPSINFDSFGYSELLESGQMIGPRLYTVGQAIYGSLFNGIRLDSFNDAISIADKRKELGGTVIKQYKQPSRLKRQWLLLASRGAGLNMTNEGQEDPLIQIGMIKDGSTGIEHSPVWGPVFNDVITLFAKSGTYLTPTYQTSYAPKYPASNYFLPKYWSAPNEKLKRFSPVNVDPNESGTLDFLYPAKMYANIFKQGGKVALGSHSEPQAVSVHNELWALQMGGLTNMEALHAATIMGAEGLGIQKDVGSIEVGKIADLIILNKNPLDDIHNSREIRYVMKNGVLYDGDTLDEIWPIRENVLNRK